MSAVAVVAGYGTIAAPTDAAAFIVAVVAAVDVAVAV